MITTYPTRDPNEQLSPHFKRGEFACKKCCDPPFMDPDPELVAGLEALRVLLNRPISIDDACRCPEHNAQVGGVPHSQHEEGKAADITVPERYTNDSLQMIPAMSAYDLYLAAVKIPQFASGGIGVSQATYIHVDVRGVRARWQYDASGKEIPWGTGPSPRQQT